jgi:hypothetical protein
VICNWRWTVNQRDLESMLPHQLANRSTNSTSAFAYHIRTFSTTFPNVRQDGLNEWDPLLNHPTFSAPNLQATNAQFGVISSVANRPRAIQVGARFVF